MLSSYTELSPFSSFWVRESFRGGGGGAIGCQISDYRNKKSQISIFYENCQLSEIGTYVKKKVANVGLSVLKSSNIGYR